MKISMRKETKNKKIEPAFKEFIRYCKIKNLSEETIDYYENCFIRFKQICSEVSLTNEINKKIVNDYILALKLDDKLNDVTVNTMLRGLRAVLYYFMKLGYTEEFKVELIKAEKKVKETYSDKELELLLKKPNIKECIFTEYRDWVTVNYLLATGNRASTVVNLKIGDIDLDDEVILLKRTKNKKQQIIPLSKTMSKIIKEYLTYRQGDSDDYIFCSIYGQKLTVDALGQSIRKYNRRRGVMKTSVHLFRHTFAKKWILSGGDIFRLQKILGHSSMDIVREYVNMFAYDLRRDFNRFNPLEQMTSNNKQYIKVR